MRLFGIFLIGFLISNASAESCRTDLRTFQTEVIEALRDDYADNPFRKGATEDIVLLGEVEFGLANLLAKICLSSPALSAEQRAEEIRAHFEALRPIIGRPNIIAPVSWNEAKSNVVLQFAPDTYVTKVLGPTALVWRRFVEGVSLAVVINQENGYQYVRNDDLEDWEVQEEKLFAVAAKNLDEMNLNVQLQGSGGEYKFLAVEEKDGFDAARLMLPWIRTKAAEVLGDPFYAYVANRDFLMMWSTSNPPDFQKFVRDKAAEAYESQPYPLLPHVLKVWASGKVEIE